MTTENTVLNSTPDEISRRLLYALGFAQVCSWGTLYYAFPQIAVEMVKEFGWSKPNVYGALTLGLLLSSVGVLPVGMAIDKGYGRVVMAGGSILAGLLLLMWSQTQSLLWFYFAVLGIGFLHAAVLYDPTFAVIARHSNPQKVRKHITTITLWAGFASTIFIPLIEFLLNYVDWRGVLIILACVNIFLCAGIYQCLPRSTRSFSSEKTDSDAKDPDELGVKWALKQRVFWALLLCFALYWAMESAFRFHFYPLLIGNGLTGENAVFIIALLGPSQVAGRVAMSIFSGISLAHIGMFVLSIFPMAFIVMVYVPDNYSVLVAVTICYGAAAGITTIVRANAIPELLTRKSYGVINGLMITPITVLAAIAPTIAAFSWSHSGSYTWMLNSLLFSSTIACLLFVLAVIWSVKSTRLNT